MSDPSIKRQRERDRRERRERERLEQLARDQQHVDNQKNNWAQVSVGNQRAYDLLAAHQRAVYYHKAEKLVALNRIVNGE